MVLKRATALLPTPKPRSKSGFSSTSQWRGWRNFECALAAFTCDIVFLSDQDGVWFPDRISTVVDALSRAPRTELVLNDLVNTDTDLVPRAESCLQCHRLFGSPDTQCMTGRATVVRRRLLDPALPIPESVLGDDHWLHVLARARGTRAFPD